MFSKALINNEFFTDELAYKENEEISPSNLAYYNVLPDELKLLNKINSIQELNCKNFKYSKDEFIAKNNKLFKIYDIIVEKKEAYLVVTKVKTTFVNKFLSYKILEESNEFDVIRPNKLLAVTPIIKNNLTYVRINEF